MSTIVQVLNIWISPEHDFKGQHGKGRKGVDMKPVEGITCVAGKGIKGDRYYGYKEDYKGQITLFSEDVARKLEEDLEIAALDRSAMRRNVLIAGVDLNSLIGKRFRLGELILSGSEECAPCYWMDEVVKPGAHEWLKGNGGLRCRIETGGRLMAGSAELEIL